jgi:hypothetical protein
MSTIPMLHILRNTDTVLWGTTRSNLVQVVVSMWSAVNILKIAGDKIRKKKMYNKPNPRRHAQTGLCKNQDWIITIHGITFRLQLLPQEWWNHYMQGFACHT